MGRRIKQKYLFSILYACIALSLIAGVHIQFFTPFHANFLWQEIPGFTAIYGFFGCITIIIVSKALGHHWLQKEEDYYEKH
jgi:uncharacterized membrane protein YbhN (UPF0104 family)